MSSPSELSSLSPLSDPPNDEIPFLDPSLPKKRRSPLSIDEKLDRFFDLLRDDLYWTFDELISALITKADHKSSRRQTAFAKAAYMDPHILQYFITHKNLGKKVRKALLDATDTGNTELRDEIRLLGQKAPFGHYSHESTGFEALNLTQLYGVAEQHASKTLLLLQNITRPVKSDTHGRYEYMARFILILAILCYTQRRNSSSNFQTILGLYFHSKGVKRRQLDVLAQFGITTSYQTISRTIKLLSDKATDSVALAGGSLDAVTAYDNFEQVEGVKEQRLDDNSTFRSVTTGEVVQGRCIPPGGLVQNMLDPQVQLNINDVLFAPGNMIDDTESQVRSTLLYSA